MPPRAALEQVQHRASPEPIVRCLLKDEADACNRRVPLRAAKLRIRRRGSSKGSKAQ